MSVANTQAYDVTIKHLLRAFGLADVPLKGERRQIKCATAFGQNGIWPNASYGSMRLKNPD